MPGTAKAAYITEVAPAAITKLSLATKTKPTASEQVLVLDEAMKLLTLLVEQATDDDRSQIMAMLVALLVALLETEPASCGAVRLQLHQLDLNTLNRVGPMFPAAFKAVITGAPALAQRMTAAVRASAAQASHAANNSTAAREQQAKALAGAKPKIALKMDFSAFG